MYMKERLEKAGKKITDIKILKSKIIIYFLNEKIEISPDTFTEFNLFINKRLNEDKIKSIVNYDNFQKDLNYALKLVNKYVYSSSKLKKKLSAKGINENNIERIIDYLNKHHLIDDKILAKDLAYNMLKHLKGPNKIKNYLFSLGINKEIVDEIIYNLDDKTIIHNLKNKIKLLNNRYRNSINKKERIVRTLINDGYSLDMIYSVTSDITISAGERKKALMEDYLKLSRQYDETQKIIESLKRKGYRYNEIKNILKERDYDLH